MSTQKPTKPAMKKNANNRLKQWAGNGQRDKKGRFLPGHSFGFKPGQSGNVKGRRDALADILRRRLPEVRDSKDGRSNAELIADALLEEAIYGNIQAAREIFNRVEGRPKQAVDITVKKSETEMYEGMISDLIEHATAKKIKLSRAEAIQCLARHDARILEVVELASDEVQ